MSRQPGFYQWTEALTSHFPDLSKPQVYGLALWSWGMLLARCCSLTTVAFYLHLHSRRPLPNLQQQLREWYQEAKAKKGKKRRHLEVTTCFAPLLRWVLEDWPNTQLAVAADATTLGTRFVVLCLSVV